MQVDFSQSVYHLWKQFRRFGRDGGAPDPLQAPPTGAPGAIGGHDRLQLKVYFLSHPDCCSLMARHGGTSKPVWHKLRCMLHELHKVSFLLLHELLQALTLGPVREISLGPVEEFFCVSTFCDHCYLDGFTTRTL